jgi:hypothetical protein
MLTRSADMFAVVMGGVRSSRRRVGWRRRCGVIVWLLSADDCLTASVVRLGCSEAAVDTPKVIDHT